MEDGVLMAVVFYEYAKCSTCVKARKWLESRNIAFKAIPIVENPPTATELKALFDNSGIDIKKFFNTSGQSYRELKLSDKLPVMSHKELFELLANDGKLIKRPLLIDGDFLALGFDEKVYKSHFA